MNRIHYVLRHGMHGKLYPMHVNARNLAHGQDPSGWPSESPPLITAAGVDFGWQNPRGLIALLMCAFCFLRCCRWSMGSGYCGLGTWFCGCVQLARYQCFWEQATSRSCRVKSKRNLATIPRPEDRYSSCLLRPIQNRITLSTLPSMIKSTPQTCTLSSSNNTSSHRSRLSLSFQPPSHQAHKQILIGIAVCTFCPAIS
jgi:hypothetical protein